MSDYDDKAEKARKLTEDLQKAALNLIKHSGINNFRIRIEGSVPAVYITLGEGRSSYSADSVVSHGQQGETPQLMPDLEAVPVHVAAQDSAQRAPLAAYFSKLKKVLAA